MRTPLNYTGNKSRLVSIFNEIFPREIGTFVDLFCGGGSVGLSVDAKNIVFIDNNTHVINLLKHLSVDSTEVLLQRLERLVEKYNLSYSGKYGYATYKAQLREHDNNGLKEYNSAGFYKLRTDYNSITDKESQQALDMLYLLVVYGFNNDMRFNRDGEFNLPAGKTDLNKSNLRKLIYYRQRTLQIRHEFICADFRSAEVRKILDAADFIYADPPYLLGHAVYNENGNWTLTHETSLLNLLEELHSEGKQFALSNVISTVATAHPLLSQWGPFIRNDAHIVDIDYHYRSSSYNKKNRNLEEREVLITNINHAQYHKPQIHWK